MKYQKQPEKLSVPLKKFVAKDIMEEVKKMDRDKARAYLKKRWGNKEPKKAPKGQVSQEEFNDIFKETP
ncbi:MAG: hypothetical protein ACW98X_24690 [Promethearchaeota archaeon]|jgi:hypothetical protein